MNLRLFLVLALLFSLPAAASTISGTVRAADSGSALAAMIVQAYDASGIARATATTDANGRYSLTLNAGTYRILAYDNAGVYATSFYDNAESFDTSSALALQNGQTLANRDFALVRAGTIAGTVTSPSANALSGMTVAVYNLSGTLRGKTITDSAGHFQLVVPPGTYKVAAWDDALAWATTFYASAATFVSATPVDVSASRATTANLTLSPTAHVRGTVTDELTGAAISGAIVTAYDSAGFVAASTTTSANGTYELALREGAYRFVFEERSGLYAAAFYAHAQSFERGTVVNVAAGETRTGIDAALPRAATLRGVVRDSNGAPLAQITVAAFNFDGTLRTFTTTAVDGTFTLLVPTGDYKLAAYDVALTYATQYATAQSSFVAANVLHVVAPQQLNAIDFALVRGGQLTGRVVAQNGVPLANITVAAYDAAGTLVASALTNAEGNYRFVVAPGTYSVAAFDRALQYAPSSAQTLAINAATTTTRDFALPLAATVHITARDITTHEPVAGIYVSAYDSAGALAATTITAADGTAGFALASGTYRFVAYDPVQRYATSYYANAPSFDSAMPLTLVSGQSAAELAFQLTAAPRGARRHAVRH